MFILVWNPKHDEKRHLSQRSSSNSCTSKDKVLFVLFFNYTPSHGGYWGSRGIAPRILDLGTRWRTVVSFTTAAALPRGKEPLVLIGKEAGWAPKLVWTW
jgi:hypothetical protein